MHDLSRWCVDKVLRMAKGFQRSITIACCAGLVLAGCSTVTAPDDTINPTLAVTAVEPTAGYMAWRLPKTVIEATVTFKYAGCTEVIGNKPELKLERTVALVAKGVPDDHIYEDSSLGPMVRVPVSAMSSLFQDRSLSFKRAPNGTLSELGAQVEDQTAGIVSNVLSSAVKVAGIAFGVPSAGPSAVEPAVRCSTVPQEIKAEMARLKTLLRDPATSLASAEAYKLLLADQQKRQDKLTITVTRLIDPGVTPADLPDTCLDAERALGCPADRPGQLDVDDRIATIRPPLKDVIEANWLAGDTDEFKGAVEDARVSIFLDFARASPNVLRICPASGSCRHRPTVIGKDTLFREVAYIPIIVVSEQNPRDAAKRFEFSVNGVKGPPALPFAQFGLPRALPIKAGAFEKLGWTFGFNEFGENTNGSFGSSARGMKASSAMLSATSAASSFAKLEQSADALPDPETARIQAEAAKLKAQIDLAKYRKEVDELRAKGELLE
jgi:hypothetical protein